MVIGWFILIWHSSSRFGALFNMARLVLDDFRGGFEKGPWWQRLFNGYSVTTWLVVLNLGSTGLLVSWLMKYADNIVKVYSTSMAMLLTMVLSEFLFSFKVSKSNWPCFRHGLYVHQDLLQQSFLWVYYIFWINYYIYIYICILLIFY